jgi:hypothetical protein
MYCRPITWMFSDFPFGGSFWSALAYSRVVWAVVSSPSGPELGGFWIEESFVKVSTARPVRITAAATVQPTSRRVLPRICAATAPLRWRKRISA